MNLTTVRIQTVVSKLQNSLKTWNLSLTQLMTKFMLKITKSDLVLKEKSTVLFKLNLCYWLETYTLFLLTTYQL